MINKVGRCGAKNVARMERKNTSVWNVILKAKWESRIERLGHFWEGNIKVNVI